VRFRVCAFQGPDETILITALPLTDVDDTIERLITVEAIVGASVVAILAAVAWWVLRLGIRPIKQMTRTAERIAGGDLSHRAPAAPASTEAGQLSTALNQMLERLDTAFTARAESEDRLRQFVADASHELRTPVTTIRGYAELYGVGGLDGPASSTRRCGAPSRSRCEWPVSSTTCSPSPDSTRTGRSSSDRST
jgi:two-component system, OmpR family, sensor kinase